MEAIILPSAAFFQKMTVLFNLLKVTYMFPSELRPDVSDVIDVETVAVCINLYFLFDDSGLTLLHNPF